jgi:hypothetical protein
MNRRKIVDYSHFERATLNSLAPRGVGTSMVESLESYLPRLARVHEVPRQQVELFVAKSAVPTLFRDTSYQPFRLDSPTPISQQFSSRLSAMTKQPAVARLGLGWLTGTLANQGCLRKHGAWCISCMQGMAREGGAYIPLIWLLESVAACPVHNERLQHVCPHCDERISLRRTWGSQCSECPHCDRTLCQLSHITARNGSLVPVKANDAEVTKSKLVAEFIETLQKQPSEWTPGRPDVARLIESAIRRDVFPTRVALAREAGISKGSLHLYEHQGGNPSLDCLARLSVAAGVGLAGLFVPEAWIERSDDCAFGSCAGLQPRPRRPRRDWVSVRAHAENYLLAEVPLTTAELARKIGTCPSYLRKQIGARATDLDEAVRNRNEQLRQEAAKRLAGVIEEKAALLTTAGAKVSVRKLAKSVKVRRNSRRFNTALAIARERGSVKPALSMRPPAVEAALAAALPASDA